jgi:hypothetical protein
LIAGLRRLVFRRQIDPELRHLHLAAALGEDFGMELFMENPRARGHPLHVAGTDHAAGAGRIAMGDLPAIDDRDGLEAAMRMLDDAASLRGRLEAPRRGVVEQQEGACAFAGLLRRKQAPHEKSVAHPMGRGRIIDGERLSHEPAPESRRDPA